VHRILTLQSCCAHPSPHFFSPSLRSGHASWLSGSPGNTSFVVFGGQAGTSPQAPFLGDTWAWPLLQRGEGGGERGQQPAAWTQLQTAVYHPSTTQPDARAVMAVASPRISAGSPPASPASAAASGDRPVIVGGFSGYQGGLDDLLLNDTWVWSA
jgi:hypothetical protein